MAFFLTVLEIILLIATVASFIPQFRNIEKRGDISGISIYYVFINLLSATEQWAMYFLCSVNDHSGSIFDRGGITNLLQFVAVFTMWFIWFGLCLYYSSDKYPLQVRVALSNVFLGFFATAVITSAMNIPWAWYFAFEFVNPVMTLLCILAIVLQDRELRALPEEEEGALSAQALKIQAGVFGVIALAWNWRLIIKENPGDISMVPMLTYLLDWYRFKSWAVLNNGIFAVGQAVLFWRARQRQHRIVANRPTEGEAEALLSED